VIRRARDEAGQSLAEFAILLPLLLFVLIGVFEFGRAWNVYQVVVNAAREGGRVAALPTGFANADSVEARVETYLGSASVDTDAAVVDHDNVEGGTGTLATVTVQVPYDFQFVGPLAQLLVPASALGGDIVLSSTVQMRNE
jgi:Flp pilus assembly protein TadG